MPDIIKFILVLIVIWIIYQVFTTSLATLSRKAVVKRIQSKKVSDEQLTKLYEAVKKSNRYNTAKAIFAYGVFYRNPAKQNERLLAAYQAEMEKRNLL